MTFQPETPHRAITEPRWATHGSTCALEDHAVGTNVMADLGA